jgi:hypothetical protein
MIEAIFASPVLLTENMHRHPALLLFRDELPPKVESRHLCLRHVASIDDRPAFAKWCLSDAYELRVEIKRRDGATRIVRDYILPQRPEKLLHAAAACGLREHYEVGELEAEDFLGKTGKLKLGTQKSRDYPAKNVVLDYV